MSKFSHVDNDTGDDAEVFDNTSTFSTETAELMRRKTTCL